VFCAGDGGALGQSGQSRFRDVFRCEGKHGIVWTGRKSGQTALSTRLRGWRVLCGRWWRLGTEWSVPFSRCVSVAREIREVLDGRRPGQRGQSRFLRDSIFSQGCCRIDGGGAGRGDQAGQQRDYDQGSGGQGDGRGIVAGEAVEESGCGSCSGESDG
jgi:hypothetical protein